MIFLWLIVPYLVGVLFTFRTLESLEIGFESYWYEGDHSLEWVLPALGVSLLWPITVPLMLLWRFVLRGLWRAIDRAISVSISAVVEVIKGENNDS